MVIIFFLPAVAIIIIVLEHQCWNMVLLVFFNLKNINLPNRGIGYLSYLGNAQKKTFGMFCLITSLGKGGPSLEYWPELSNTRQRDCNAGEARDNVTDQECYTWHNENAGNI